MNDRLTSSEQSASRARYGIPTERDIERAKGLADEIPEQSESLRCQSWPPLTGPWPKARIVRDEIVLYEPGHGRGISRHDARRLAGELVRCDAELERDSRS